MKEAYYFSHDSNARNDERICELRSELGWEGYGLYFATIELLRDSSNYTLPAKPAMLRQMLGDATAVLVARFYEMCIELGLFIVKGDRFYSESLMKRMEQVDEIRAKRVESGRLGGVATASAKHLPQQGKERKVNENKEIKVREVEPRPLSLQEVQSLFQERAYPNPEVEAEKFWNYYESNGWRVGKNPMKSWKAAAANWAKNINEFSQKQNGTYQQNAKRSLTNEEYLSIPDEALL